MNSALANATQAGRYAHPRASYSYRFEEIDGTIADTQSAVATATPAASTTDCVENMVVDAVSDAPAPPLHIVLSDLGLHTSIAYFKKLFIIRRKCP